MTDLFDVLADPTRRDIVALLNQPAGESTDLPAELSVGHLVEALGVTQPTVSKHLKVLRDADIVRVREEGQHRYYRLHAETLAPIAQWLSTLSPTTAPSGPSSLERQTPYLDLWPVGFQIGRLIADTRDALLDVVDRLNIR
jgi:ArsR family transcriptional regulator, arsenate/arsenite/antimonite-responsive transcriptional repressor